MAEDFLGFVIFYHTVVHKRYRVSVLLLAPIRGLGCVATAVPSVRCYSLSCIRNLENVGNQCSVPIDACYFLRFQKYPRRCHLLGFLIGRPSPAFYSMDVEE